ncbi:MAG: 50S ribosomal protein L29 [Nitrospina sp.]|nr:50S ribosomal protein L29 [Nitrospina sp.]
MKPQEIRELSEKELEEKLEDSKEELFNLKFQLATGKIQNPGRIVHLRRDIARINTIINERKRAQAASAPAADDAAKA